MRDRERTSVEHNRHRPDTVTTLASNLPMPIGDDFPISQGIALGPVERVLDALVAGDCSEIDERSLCCRHGDRVNVGDIAGCEIQ